MRAVMVRAVRTGHDGSRTVPGSQLLEDRQCLQPGRKQSDSLNTSSLNVSGRVLTICFAQSDEAHEMVRTTRNPMSTSSPSPVCKLLDAERNSSA